MARQLRHGSLTSRLSVISSHLSPVCSATSAQTAFFRSQHTHSSACGHSHDEKCDPFTPEVSKVFHRQLSNYIERNATNETIGGTMPELEDILANNKVWVKEKNKSDPTFFERISRGQKPRYLYIGCSDARVDPGQLMGLRNAELFVHRNVGNVVSGTDLNFLSVLEYAVNVLEVPHIIVCGHYDCGAVRGSIARPESGGLGLIENWLRNIRDVARLHMKELKEIQDSEQRQRRLVELNIMEQCLNIFKVGCVQRRRLKTFVQSNSSFALPRVHGLVFDVSDGILKKLPLDFKKEIDDYREIYDLYQVPAWIKQRNSADNDNMEFWKGNKNLASDDAKLVLVDTVEKKDK